MTGPHPSDEPIILVVDDDHDARFIYALYLRTCGCRVFTAGDSRTAIEKATTLCPDVIILDLAKPKAGGWAAIRQMAQSRWTHDIPVLALSAAPEAREGALVYGAWVLPFSSKNLSATISFWVGITPSANFVVAR